MVDTHTLTPATTNTTCPTRPAVVVRLSIQDRQAPTLPSSIPPHGGVGIERRERNGLVERPAPHPGRQAAPDHHHSLENWIVVGGLSPSVKRQQLLREVDSCWCLVPSLQPHPLPLLRIVEVVGVLGIGTALLAQSVNHAALAGTSSAVTGVSRCPSMR
jgi:hypothetical protein